MIPCHNCIALPICKGKVEDFVEKVGSQFTLPIYGLSYKCSLINEYLEIKGPKDPTRPIEYNTAKMKNLAKFYRIGVHDE